jgi:hypothetical protein
LVGGPPPLVAFRSGFRLAIRVCQRVASADMKKVKAPTTKKKSTKTKQQPAAPISRAKAKGKGKVAKSSKKPADYLVMVFCGRKYSSVITTLVTTDKKEAYAEAQWLASRAVSEKGDRVDIAVFKSDCSWDDEKGWKFFS